MIKKSEIINKDISKNTKSGGVIKSYIIIYKNKGMFYNSFNIDAYILNFLLGFKVLDSRKCGFPESSLVKVLDLLDEKKIDYQIIYTYQEPTIKEFGKLNKYKHFYDIAINNMDKKKRIDLLIEKISNANSDEVEKILKVLENV